MSAMMIAGPRVYFAMARDGVFPSTAGEIHPKFHAPAHAIIAQALWSGVLVLSGSLSQLVNYTGFAVVLFSAIAVAAVFVLRRREPREDRPFRAWGEPGAPATFVVASAAMLGSILWNTPLASSLRGFVIIAAGLPLYWWMRRPHA
jgi:APA family basic amino acid/polyamine antiporter